MMKSHLLFIYFFCFVSGTKVKKEEEIIYATSIVALGELKEVENKYFNRLIDYVNLLQEQVDSINEFLHMIKHDNLNGAEHGLKYVENPLLFLRLVSKGLRYIKEQKNLKTLLEDMDKLVAQVPTKIDMDEALMGMERIERFYDLKAVDIAKGFVGIKQFNNKMSAPECLMLAEFLYNKTEYFRAAQWYRLALFYDKQPDNPIQIEFYAINRTEIIQKFLKSRINEAKHP